MIEAVKELKKRLQLPHNLIFLYNLFFKRIFGRELNVDDVNRYGN